MKAPFRLHARQIKRWNVIGASYRVSVTESTVWHWVLCSAVLHLCEIADRLWLAAAVCRRRCIKKLNWAQRHVPDKSAWNHCVTTGCVDHLCCAHTALFSSLDVFLLSRFLKQLLSSVRGFTKYFRSRCRCNFKRWFMSGRSEYLIHYSALETPKVDLSLASVSVGCSCTVHQLHSVRSRLKTLNHFKWMHCFLLSSRWAGRFIVGHCGRVWGSGSWLWSLASVDSTLCFLLTNRCDCRVLLYVLAGVPLVNSERSAAVAHPCTWLLSAGCLHKSGLVVLQFAGIMSFSCQACHLRSPQIGCIKMSTVCPQWLTLLVLALEKTNRQGSSTRMMRFLPPAQAFQAQWCIFTRAYWLPLSPIAYHFLVTTGSWKPWMNETPTPSRLSWK